jgi:DNA-3-methyladenine glycosylase I
VCLGARDVERLMKDESIIRNRMKIQATIENAKRIKAIQRDMGSFAEWLKSHHPKRKDEWVKLFKKTFVFTGGEIVGEFLMSVGYLPGAHHAGCPTYKRIAKLKPAWADAEKNGFRY